jgi:hypothetical protein
MPTNIRITVIIGLALTALFAAALLANSWLSAREDRVRLAATLEAQRAVIAAVEQREEARAAELRTALDQISALKRRVQTPQQAAEQLPGTLPPLPEPIEIHVPEPDPSAPKDQAPPPATATIPQSDLKPLFDYVQDCRACQLQLSATRADLADERTKSEAIARERDAAVKAAKGGSFWSRVKRGAKWFAIGAAVGAVTATAASH